MHGNGTQIIEGHGIVLGQIEGWGCHKGVDTTSIYPTGWISPTEGGV